MMRQKIPLMLAFCLVLVTPGLTLAQTNPPYYISFEVVLRVPVSADTPTLEKQVLTWRAVLQANNKPVTSRSQNPTTPGSTTTTPTGYKDLALYRMMVRIEPEQKGGQLTLMDSDDAILASQQLDWTFPAGDYQFNGVFVLKGATAEIDKASVQLRAGLPDWSSSLKTQLVAVASTASPELTATPGTASQSGVRRSSGNPLVLIILTVVFFGLAGVMLVHGFQIGLFGKRNKATVVNPVLKETDPSKAVMQVATPQEQSEKLKEKRKEKVKTVKGKNRSSKELLLTTSMPNISHPAADGGVHEDFTQLAELEAPHTIPTSPLFSNQGGAGFGGNGLDGAEDADNLSDSIGWVGGAVKEIGGTFGIVPNVPPSVSENLIGVADEMPKTMPTIMSPQTTQTIRLWLPPQEDGKTTFVGKRKHLDSQFERKSLDFMLGSASKWLHADIVEIDNQVFLSDLAGGLWMKVAGMGFGPAESAFMQNEARLDFLLEVFRAGYPKKLVAVECDGSQHFTDPVQQARDVKKNRILDKLGIPLVRVTQVHQLEERLKELNPVLWEGQVAPLHPHTVLRLPGVVNRKVTRWQRNRKRHRKAA